MHFDLTSSRIWLLFYGYYAALIRGEALIIGKRLFQCGYPKAWRLLEGAAYRGPTFIRGNMVNIFSYKMFKF